MAKVDNLEFLSDIVPRTTTWSEYKKQKDREGRDSGATDTKKVQPLPPGQTTLDGLHSEPSHITIQMKESNDEPDPEVLPSDPPDQAVVTNGDAPVNGSGSLVFKHYEPNGGDARDQDGDVEMR